MGLGATPGKRYLRNVADVFAPACLHSVASRGRSIPAADIWGRAVSGILHCRLRFGVRVHSRDRKVGPVALRLFSSDRSADLTAQSMSEGPMDPLFHKQGRGLRPRGLLVGRRGKHPDNCAVVFFDAACTGAVGVYGWLMEVG